ncbi:DUF1194 domain-containing protein [Roseovarius nanhaiticus]|uniref:DUF1194 domain-containing protein n=1 Tax=Roseovarius nanhaiticus TaxID=573024 RepID=UPI002490D3F7|nr:DUF1194 domain-containing protein [Roseovarius nanhaiticus]
MRRAYRRMARVTGLAGLALALCLAAAPANAACRLALALGLDVSGSVDDVEYRLQLGGVADALMASEVQAAMFAMPGAHVSLAVYQWGAEDQQNLLIGWTDLKSPEDVTRVAESLLAYEARFRDPYTALGAAMRYGAALLRERPECWQHTLDISGDGPSNAGPAPRDALTDPQSRITVNALVINPGSRDNVTKDLTYTKTLLEHYRTHVLRGPGAFAETARDFDDFKAAMTRKLLRELRPAALSLAPPVQ